MRKILLLSILVLGFNAYSKEDSKLVKAIHDSSVEEVKALAKSPTELNWKDESGFDALFYAVSINDTEKLTALLDAGASTQNLYTDKKESLLFEAARMGSVPALEILIKKDPTLLKIKDLDGESPLFIAVREDQSQVVSFLVEKGLSVKEKNKAGKTPAQFVRPSNKKMTSLFKKLKSAK